MALILHFHPLSSFCQKALIGLYELDVPFAKQVVDLYDAEQRARFLALWPIGKFPVLRDEARGVTVPETTVILDYIDRTGRLVPADADRARECRLRDRVFDLYLNVPIGKVVTDKLRPPGKNDPHGVEEARALIAKTCELADEWLRGGPWAAGESFSIADCAAAPALFFAKRVQPFDSGQRHLAAYFTRLEARPSVARAFAEAQPFLANFPG
jgi:glutathione S-transferase